MDTHKCAFNFSMFYFRPDVLTLYPTNFADNLEKETSFIQKRMLALEPRIEVISNDIEVFLQPPLQICSETNLLVIYKIKPYIYHERLR